MTTQSRRGFLRNASLGTGVAAVAALAPQGSAEAAPTAGAGTHRGPLPAGPVMAYVSDPGTGEIALFVGSEEFTYRDRDLAGRLARAVQQVRPA